MSTAARPSPSTQMPIKHEGFLRHRNYFYLKVATAVMAACITFYVFADVGLRHNGGTWLGYTLGVISAGLIVWLTFLGARKRAITGGAWRLKGWTSAHVYLGGSLLVLATLHTGFQFGWNVHTLAYALMVLVIFSGFFGVFYYSTVPGKMSENRALRGEKDMLEQLQGVDRDLVAVAQPLERAYVDVVQEAIQRNRIRPGLFGSIERVQRRCATTKAIERLTVARDAAKPEMRANLDNTLAVLTRKRELLLRARRHIRYKTLLQMWLYVHVPVTFALLAALFAHIVSVFFYW